MRLAERGALRRIAAATVAAVAAGALLVGCGGGGDDDRYAGGPVAAVQDDHLPVVPVEGLETRLDMVAATGVTTTRVDLFWKDIAPGRPARPADPDDPAYDWTRADTILRGLQERGITPIVSVYNTPAWAGTRPAPEPMPPVNTTTPDPRAFGAFMRALATRYSGTYTPPGADGPLPEIRYLELWNEPNLSGFLTPQVEDGRRVSLDNYAAMVRAATPAVRAANPDAVVIVGVAGPRSSSSDTGTGALQWMRGLIARRVPISAYSQHIYPASPPTAETDVVPSWASVDRLLDNLDAAGPDIPLFITEAGYTTATTPYRDTKVTDEEQAQYLGEIYALPQLRNPRVRAVVWFNLQDNANWPAGLLREDGSEKPSYGVFRDVVGAQDGARLTP